MNTTLWACLSSPQTYSAMPSFSRSHVCHFFESLQPDQDSSEVSRQRGLHLVSKTAQYRANYTTVAQNRDELMVPDNSPSVSMWPYLVKIAQPNRLPLISVYAQRGPSGERARLLYMNAEALTLWQDMGMPGVVIGELHRPPGNAVLAFGMPFSE